MRIGKIIEKSLLTKKDSHDNITVLCRIKEGRDGIGKRSEKYAKKYIKSKKEEIEQFKK